jgi:5'-nucleotidase
MRTLRLSLAGTVILMLLGGLGGTVFAQADDLGVESPVSVTFFHTADIHEHGKSLSRIAGYVESRRDENPNVLFVDSGDWFNNGELSGLHTRGEAITAMLGASGYDAMIPGNHEYSFGTERLAELIDRFALPVVAANVTWPEDMEPEHALPYRVFDLDGVTVAIIGTLTSFVGPEYAMQEADDLLECFPIEESIGDLVAMLDERADIVVLLTHEGSGADKRLAQALTGIDIIFGGHSHDMFRSLVIADGTDTIVQHSGANGSTFGELTVTWDGDQIVEPELRVVPVSRQLPVSVAVERIREEY